MLHFNDTLGMNISKTTPLSAGDQFGLPLSHGATIGAINFLLSITGTFGNFLIIFAILTTPQLRQRPSNFLLLSLAVTDLLVTTVAQPLFASNVFLKTRGNTCARGIDMAFMMSATFSAGSSINHLAVISIDRALATVRPHKHYNILKHWYKVMLSVCWVSVALAVIVYFSVKFIKAGKSAALTLSILIAVYITIDFLIMLGSYAIIIYRIKFPKVQPGARSSTARERAMEKRVSGTIAILILFFAATWFPYTGYRISHTDTSAHCSFDLTLLWIRTLFLSNSSINFIVYSSRIRQFRTAYLRIITRMLQPFRTVVGKCFSTSSDQQYMNTTQNTIVLSSINTTSLSNEMQEVSEKKDTYQAAQQLKCETL